MVLLLKKGDPGSYVCSLVKSVTLMTFPPNSADSTLNPISLRVSLLGLHEARGALTEQGTRSVLWSCRLNTTDSCSWSRKSHVRALSTPGEEPGPAQLLLVLCR